MSALGHFRTSAFASVMSDIGGKTDIDSQSGVVLNHYV